jgi:hypothetical protein|tara:strand:+ start:3813 stop:3989 length:177 start_codon:yes stop_codon:yes gene_type:complete
MSEVILNKIKQWLEDEVKTFEDNPIDEGIESEEQGIFIGRAEMAEGLLEQIEQWEKIK